MFEFFFTNMYSWLISKFSFIDLIGWAEIGSCTGSCNSAMDQSACSFYCFPFIKGNIIRKYCLVLRNKHVNLQYRYFGAKEFCSEGLGNELAFTFVKMTELIMWFSNPKSQKKVALLVWVTTNFDMQFNCSPDRILDKKCRKSFY